MSKPLSFALVLLAFCCFLTTSVVWAAPRIEVLVNSNGLLNSVRLTEKTGAVKVVLWLNQNGIVDSFMVSSKELEIRLQTNGSLQIVALRMSSTKALKYDKLGRLVQVGGTTLKLDNFGRLVSFAGQKLLYSRQGRLTSLGALTVVYERSLYLKSFAGLPATIDLRSRVTKVGTVALQYDVNSRALKIGLQSLQYLNNPQLLKKVQGKDSRFRLRVLWNVPNKCVPFLCR
jgi:hypothetical protein